MESLAAGTTLVARTGRTLANALTVELKDGTGADVGAARQKNSAGVLLGFRNGGKSRYELTLGDRTYALDVGATTTVARDGRPVGRIVPHDGAARLESAGGTVLALLRPHAGPKADDPWEHPLQAPDGSALGSLSLIRSHITMNDVIDELLLGDKAGPLKAPSAGARVSLTAPVTGPLAELLPAACVDACVLPRGYVSG
jgi:antitoxin (DNA-binding transcriptional repressor) of toxin-antitoxin stability system